jgi:hypothetical protein
MSSDGSGISNFRRKYFIRENRCFHYVATALELTLETLLLLVVTLGLSALLLLLVNMCWHTYRDTHVGLVFVKQLGNNYGFLTKILNQDIIKVSYHLTLSAFLLCLIISSACQFVYLGRFFMGSNGWLHKFMYWGIPLTFIVSAYFYRWPIFPVDRWGVAYILYFAPTLCVYGLCFKITDRLLPEIGTVIIAFFKATRFIIARVRSADDEAPIVTVQPAHPDPPLQAKPVASMKVNEQIDTPSIEKKIQPIPGR